MARPLKTKPLTADPPKELKWDAATAKVLASFPEFRKRRLETLLTRYATGTGTRQEINEIADAGLIEGEKQEGAKLPNSDSTNDLAIRLAKHFEGRVSIQIRRGIVGCWRNGQRLPAGIPLPPGLTSDQRHNTQGWADWFEKHMMGKYGLKTATNGHSHKEAEGPSVFELADKADAERKIDEAFTARREREATEGKYFETERHLKLMRTMGSVLNQAITNHAEKRMAEMIMEGAKKSGLSEAQEQGLWVTIKAACEKQADELRETLRKAALDAGRVG